MSAAKIDRRTVIIGGATLAVAAACGGGGDDDSSSSSAPTATPSSTQDGGDTAPELVLAAGFATGDRSPPVTAAGLEQRVMFTVADVSGDFVDPVREGLPDVLPMTLHWPEAVGRSEEVQSERRDEGIPTPYYPIIFTPDETGSYRVETTVNGTLLEATFIADLPETIGLVQVGEPMRPVDTPTVDDARGVNPICTRAGEPCPFHDDTLTAAMAGGSPVALLISTPGFCQTAICGPVLDLLIGAADDYPDFSFVHAEVYNDPQTLGASDFAGVTEAVETYGMQFEPSLVVADSDGIVTARLDFTFDGVDLATALNTAV